MEYQSHYILEELKKQNVLLEKICYAIANNAQGAVEEDYITVSEFAAIVKKSEQTVRRWIKKGVIHRVIKVNNGYLIDRKEIDLLIFKTSAERSMKLA